MAPSYAPHPVNAAPPILGKAARIGLRALFTSERLASESAFALAAFLTPALAPLPTPNILPSPFTNGAINSFNCSGLFSIKIVKILICSAGENSCRFSDIILRLRLFLLSVVTLYFLRILFN